MNFCQAIKELISTVHKLFQKLKEEETLSTLFFEATVTHSGAKPKTFKSLTIREMQIKNHNELSPHTTQDGYYQKKIKGNKC